MSEKRSFCLVKFDTCFFFSGSMLTGCLGQCLIDVRSMFCCWFAGQLLACCFCFCSAAGAAGQLLVIQSSSNWVLCHVRLGPQTCHGHATPPSNPPPFPLLKIRSVRLRTRRDLDALWQGSTETSWPQDHWASSPRST